VSRSWELFLRDMLEAARKVIRYAGDRQVEAFVADEMAYDATLRNLEVLGEAGKSGPIRRSDAGLVGVSVVEPIGIEFRCACAPTH
jgi:uncharacterized protein with HEPN domain